MLFSTIASHPHFHDVVLDRLAQEPAVLVHVESTQGSAPREAGTWMAVFADTLVGTIGGGHLEYVAVAKARAHLTTANITCFQSVQHPVDLPMKLDPGLRRGDRILRFLEVANAETLALARVSEHLCLEWRVDGRGFCFFRLRMCWVLNL